MPKDHVIKLTIKNTSGYSMTNPTPWFDSGRLADDWNFPSIINPGETKVVEMYERDNVWAGCSGYVNYAINGGTITIAYSNPGSGTNKLGVGTAGKPIWDNMSNHDYDPFKQQFTINDVLFSASCRCTGGSVNNALVDLIVK